MSSPTQPPSAIPPGRTTRRALKMAKSRPGLLGSGAFAAVLALLAGMLAFGSAHSEPASGAPGDQGVLHEGALQGYLTDVRLPSGAREEVQPALMTMAIDDQTLDVYCLQVTVEAMFGPSYVETQWSESAVPNEGKVHWILQHSYPQVDATEVLRQAGIGSHGAGTDAKIALTATQAAIWHYTDGVTPLGYGGYAGPVQKLYDHLVAGATPGAAPAPVTPTISLPSGAGIADGSVGPVVVTTTDGSAAQLAITPAAQARYADGTAVDLAAVRSGVPFSIVGAPASGSYTLTATGTGTVQSGRVFTHPDAQTVVTAGGPTVTTRTSTAVIIWQAPAPTTTASTPPATSTSDVTVPTSTATTVTETPTTTAPTSTAPCGEPMTPVPDGGCEPPAPTSATPTTSAIPDTPCTTPATRGPEGDCVWPLTPTTEPSYPDTVDVPTTSPVPATTTPDSTYVTDTSGPCVTPTTVGADGISTPGAPTGVDCNTATELTLTQGPAQPDEGVPGAPHPKPDQPKEHGFLGGVLPPMAQTGVAATALAGTALLLILAGVVFTRVRPRGRHSR